MRTDQKVIEDFGVLGPKSRIIFARVRMLTLVMARHNTLVLTMLFEGLGDRRSWLGAVIADLEWLARNSFKLSEFVGGGSAGGRTSCRRKGLRLSRW